MCSRRRGARRIDFVKEVLAGFWSDVSENVQGNVHLLEFSAKPVTDEWTLRDSSLREALKVLSGSAAQGAEQRPVKSGK